MEELIQNLLTLLQERESLPYDLTELPKLVAERFTCRQPRGCEVHQAIILLRQRHRLRCRIDGGKPYLTLQTPDSGEKP